MKKWLSLTTTNHKSDEMVIAKGDSATSNHYWQEEDNQVLNAIEDFSGPNVVLPNNSTIGVTKQHSYRFRLTFLIEQRMQ